MKQVNENFQITSGATYNLIGQFVCEITSEGTLRAMTPYAAAEARFEKPVSEFTTLETAELKVKLKPSMKIKDVVLEECINVEDVNGGEDV